jgi:tetraacyldisaccharide 4'-kinase
VIVLDDGMQFYQLHRDLEIVLVDARRPFDNGWTFPRGLLREPPSHLRRADCVVITNVDKVEAGAVDYLRQTISRLAPHAPIFTAEYAVESLRALDRSGEQRPDWLQGRKIVSFCALGNPAGFEGQLERAGAEIVHRVRFPDHHEATMGELDAVITEGCAKGAEAVLVTEKDAVKLPPLGRPLPFHALLVRQRINDEAAFFARILKALGG